MEDKLCLVPYRDIVNNRTYTNVSEYFLRNNPSVRSFLGLCGSDQRIALGACSDFDLLNGFVKAYIDNSSYDAAAVKTFANIVRELSPEIDVFSEASECIWRATCSALEAEDKRARNAVALSGVKKLGVPLENAEEYDPELSTCDGTEILPVYCPFGTEGASVENLICFESIDRMCAEINSAVKIMHATAVFSAGLRFERPNEYSASCAVQKLSEGKNLNVRENAILKSQLMRYIALASERQGKELIIVLPFAPDVSSMGAVSDFLMYLDEETIRSGLNISIFARDAVGICMAAALSAAKYKKLTVLAGLGGNGSELYDADAAKYWGMSDSSISLRASLSPTPALLKKRQ